MAFLLYLLSAGDPLLIGALAMAQVDPNLLARDGLYDCSSDWHVCLSICRSSRPPRPKHPPDVFDMAQVDPNTLDLL
jgi:hypothetical protein